MISAKAFREYDVRGVVGRDLDEVGARQLGRAFAGLLAEEGKEECVIGRDLRASSPSLHRAFLRGLLEGGISVVDIGECSTPMLYTAQVVLDLPGAMVTASHNPPEWNGFKLSLAPRTTLGPEEIARLKASLGSPPASRRGSYRFLPFHDEYAEFVLRRVKVPDLRVVVNAGGGSASVSALPVLRKAGLEVIGLHEEPDPSRIANPSVPEFMKETGRKVREAKAHLGIGFDGDCDRLGVVDSKGHIVWPDRYLVFLARQVLAEEPGAPIVYDVKCSRVLSEEILKAGGRPVMWKTGHSYIKAKMRELDSPLAGEMSGHVFFRDPGFDDALLAALKLMEAVGEDLAGALDDLPKYVSTPPLHASCPDERKYDVVRALTDEFMAEGYQVITVNGVRVETQEGWGLVRASSNLPALVLRFEAIDESSLERLVNLFREKLSRFPEVSKEWRPG